jgi:Uncharacterized protein conserved in bacteria
MNYLAHAYLSFNNPDILIGNIIADFIRGKHMFDFREEIQTGIRLHRQIDEYTDNHPLTREIKAVYSDTAGRYSASFLDITFDHFLALDTLHEPSEGWLQFSLNCYKQIDERIGELPEDFRRLYAYMEKENWLYNYRHTWLIKRSFDRLTERAKFLDTDVNVYSGFEKNYDLLETAYKEFFPQLVEFTKNSISNLSDQDS